MRHQSREGSLEDAVGVNLVDIVFVNEFENGVELGTGVPRVTAVEKELPIHMPATRATARAKGIQTLGFLRRLFMRV